MPEKPQFLFVTCQVGAEKAVKQELARAWPQFRFAYSRPGFLTFKLPPDHELSDDFNLRSTFARAYGFSLGKAIGQNASECTAKAIDVIGDQPFDRLHLWRRDPVPLGNHGFEPDLQSAEQDEARRALRQAAAIVVPWTAEPSAENARTRPGELVLDCVMVEPTEWWLGYHRARSIESRWPGGIYSCETPEDMVSRAYLKMRESLAWSRLPLKRNDVVAEIGSARGGASQALLARNLRVIGIDPATMDPKILANPKFTHWQKRGHDVRRRDFRTVRWLTADINVTPTYTLDTVEEIVMHESTNVQGLLLTLKLPDWALVEELPDYLRRIRKWGFRSVRARQLSHNRQEVCVAALRTKPEGKSKSGASDGVRAT